MKPKLPKYQKWRIDDEIDLVNIICDSAFLTSSGIKRFMDNQRVVRYFVLYVVCLGKKSRFVPQPQQAIEPSASINLLSELPPERFELENSHDLSEKDGEIPGSSNSKDKNKNNRYIYTS